MKLIFSLSSLYLFFSAKIADTFMEHIVDPHYKNTTDVIDKTCITWRVHIMEGDCTVTKHYSVPQNQMPYHVDFTNGASWRSIRLCNLTIKKILYDTVIFDNILSISKSTFGFRSLIFP